MTNAHLHLPSLTATHPTLPSCHTHTPSTTPYTTLRMPLPLGTLQSPHTDTSSYIHVYHADHTLTIQFELIILLNPWLAHGQHNLDLYSVLRASTNTNVLPLRSLVRSIRTVAVFSSLAQDTSEPPPQTHFTHPRHHTLVLVLVLALALHPSRPDDGLSPPSIRSLASPRSGED